MLQLSLGVFALLALILALRESSPSIHEEDLDYPPFIPIQEAVVRTYNPEVIMDEAIEELIILQAEAIDAVSALTVSLSEIPLNSADTSLAAEAA